MKPVATAVAVLLLLAACAPSRSVPGYGAAGGTPTPAGAGEVPPPGLSASPTDVDFVDQAAASGLAEVEMARVATRQSSNSAVRDFATAMIADHGRMNAELDTAASRAGIAAPAVVDAGRQDVAGLLGATSGDAFDREYAAIQVAEHRMAIALFSAEARAGHDAGLRAFAARYAPVLRHHLDRANPLIAARTASGR